MFFSPEPSLSAQTQEFVKGKGVMVQFGRQRHRNVMLNGAERSEASLPSVRWSERFFIPLSMTASGSSDNSERRLVGHAFYPILLILRYKRWRSIARSQRLHSCCLDFFCSAATMRDRSISSKVGNSARS